VKCDCTDSLLHSYFDGELSTLDAVEFGRHVEQCAAGAAHEFSLGLRLLVVQAAQHAAGGAGVVVLHERQLDAGVAEALGVIRLHEEAALVVDELRLDDDHTAKGSLSEFKFHGGGS